MSLFAEHPRSMRVTIKSQTWEQSAISHLRGLRRLNLSENPLVSIDGLHSLNLDLLYTGGNHHIPAEQVQR